MRIILFLATMFFATNACNADVLTIKGSANPISGLVTDKSKPGDSTVEFLAFDKSNFTFEPKSFQKSEIESVVLTIDQNKLSAMSLQRLYEFRDLAEQLASNKGDPLARHFAKRLIVQCIYHESKRHPQSELLHSALKSLVAQATTEAEKQQLELIAHIYGDTRTTFSDLAIKQESTTDDTQLLKLVQHVRREDFSAAVELLEQMKFTSSTSNVEKNLVDGIRRACQERKVDSNVLVALMNKEYELRYGEQAIPANPSKFFSNEHSHSPKQPLSQLDIRSIADFDLMAIQFRNGKWHRTADTKAQK